MEKERIYSFGTREKAVAHLREWIDNIKMLPPELASLGYDRADVCEWLEQINNK